MYCNLNSDTKEVLELAYWQRPPMHQASNPRDLIYALLGLASDPTVIDTCYNLGVEYAFVSATRLLLSRGFTEILCSFKPYISSQIVSSEAFPSWAYDWSTRSISSFGKYTACGNTKPELSFKEHPGLEGKETISLKGLRFGYVTTTGDSFSVVASAAGLEAQVIQTGNIELQPPSTEGEQTIGKQIRREYQQLGVKATTETEKLFNDAPFHVAVFWIWWIKWVSKLWDLAKGIIRNQNERRAWKSVLGLLLRNKLPDLKGLAEAETLHNLTDPRFWAKTSPNASQQPNLAARSGNSAAEPVAWPNVEAVQSLFRSAWGMRPLALTGDFDLYGGYLGYGPESAEPGDEVVIFYGVTAPLVLRKVDEAATTHKIIGPAYVSGIMEGNFMDADALGRKYVLI